MNIQTYIPQESLQPFVKTFIIVEHPQGLINRILPDTSLVMVFRLSGQVNQIDRHSESNLPMSVVSGLRKSARLVNYLPGSGNLLVIFKESGASAFFKEPLHELFDLSVSLDNYFTRNAVSRIEEQLATTINNRQRIAIVEQFLLSNLRSEQKDKLVAAAIQKINNAKGIIKIKELADSLFISQDAFEKRFRKTVGTSPKQMASTVRMRSIIRQNHISGKLSDLAFDAGFFDQSHFNKDFKLFTGQAPTEFFQSPPLW